MSSATLVVIAGGNLGKRIARLGDDHAAFDRANRRVLRAEDEAYPAPEVVRQWDSHAAAVMLDSNENVIVFLDAQHATSEAWIEDAFVRARGSALR